MHPSTLNLPQIKGWLFQNLPEKHTHRYSYILLLLDQVVFTENFEPLAPPWVVR